MKLAIWKRTNITERGHTSTLLKLISIANDEELVIRIGKGVDDKP